MSSMPCDKGRVTSSGLNFYNFISNIRRIVALHQKNGYQYPILVFYAGYDSVNDSFNGVPLKELYWDRYIFSYSIGIEKRKTKSFNKDFLTPS